MEERMLLDLFRSCLGSSYERFMEELVAVRDVDYYFGAWCAVDWLLGAFVWCDTKEGHAYWEALNDEWVRECHELVGMVIGEGFRIG